MFGFFKRKRKDKIEKSVDAFNKLCEMDIHDIWLLEDPNDFVIAMYGWICEKCAYGDNMDALSDAERVFYITQLCEAEVNNGGFSQFFFNSSGNFSSQLVHAFTEIGAMKTAEICKTALAAFGKELPADLDERRHALDELESEEVVRILEECDNEFYDYEDDLLSLNYAYIQKNKDSFS